MRNDGASPFVETSSVVNDRANHARAIDRAIVYGDWLRRAVAGSGRPHKEWLHFCLYGRTADALVNFSVVDDARADRDPDREFARTTLLFRDQRWRGAVTSFASHDCELRPGEVGLRMGSHSLHYRDGVYALTAGLPDGSAHVDVTLRPTTMPSIVHNVQVGDGPPINWLVVPRLVAEGRVRIDDRVHDVSGTLAYHDHNWGHFGWGRDFAWEWGYGLPDDPANPWTIVFVRLSDRAHTRALMQGVFLWKGHREQRVFRDHDLRVSHRGLRRAREICKIPPVMALIHPQLATDIPSQLGFRGEAEGDAIDGTFECGDVAQVVIPNDDDFGVTVINEVSGRLAVEGRIHGEDMELNGRAIFEFLGA